MFNSSSWLLRDKASHRCFKIITPLIHLSHNYYFKAIRPCHSHHFCSNIKHYVLAKGDSAAAGHFFTVNDAHIL